MLLHRFKDKGKSTLNSQLSVVTADILSQINNQML